MSTVLACGAVPQASSCDAPPPTPRASGNMKSAGPYAAWRPSAPPLSPVQSGHVSSLPPH